MTEKEYIEIRGAKAHNLKDVSLDIPRGKFVVVTGLSGSGKSSLAFDTIYAEGQRRYMDTLSTYAKHFMGVLEKPEVESIDGLSPIVAIEQKTTGNNPRSTVGTITEISDFLRLLYARASRAYSPVTGKEMVRYTDDQIVSLIISEYAGRKCFLLAPLVRGRKGHYRELFEQLRKRGYTDVRVDGEIVPLSGIESVDRYKAHFIELVVDKLKPSEGDGKRIRDSVTAALGLGKGSVAMLDKDSGEIRHYSKHLVDPESGISLQEPAPHSFSFNSPEGYCPHCKGLGMIVDVNLDTIIPDRSVSVADGGIVPLGKVRETKKFDIIRAIARKYGFSLFDPIDTVPDEAISHIIFGSDDLFRIGEGAQSEMVSFGGIVEDISDKVVCPVCGGTRLNENTKCFRIDGKTISDVSAMEMTDLQEWFATLPGKLNSREMTIARDILKELRERVNFMIDVGLEYLSLDRATSSLSGGESQRIRLATQIGSKLVNVLYILDEPSIGLHQRDNRKLINSLKTLRDEGNSVMVVEHDLETMMSADWLVDVGPGAGEKGGKICLNAPLNLVLPDPEKPSPGEDVMSHCILGESLTLDYLLGRKSIPVPQSRRSGNGHFLSLKGARGNNLKNVSVDFPLGCLIGISGVSGSGKSTLINETLMPVLKNRFYRAKLRPLEYSSIEGIEYVDKLIEIDQSPIGRTPRSNPATFTGVFGDIRTLFEDTPDAKVRGFKAGRFSFNVPGGRCEACNGAGIKVIEMNFLPSVNVVCDECRGKRYNEDTLAVRYKGKSISDVLQMSISEAYEFFKPLPKIATKLKAMVDVGLGYISLGQSAVTLSGGESQRMKLAAELQRNATGNTLYILDEPTTGLHFEDIKVLLGVLQQLVDQGNTVIVIEHNLDVLKSVDYIFDLGPEGGRKGGMIVAQGTPEQISRNPDSVTGPYLAEVL
ncbi:MAG: excinuclease ABC subunit UvrA [Bacteroidales bacterium]|uniref:excinuclease ABC subunit UvrA n=1 Tax=Candidatus Cryptobacteroides sp. TaxID=2952915 RepID=UPI002A764A04|nr:excinuclease ABC subunit UvrA [Candidatus Cryptobacteroides sp.]MDD7234032.1 excinuclease ABC subunit UvrA [Bacteroidales bacterium]MDY2701807.1 excinuclease ABC subunit UvrA [Candidatus Cryptobacteroides sp.]